uniref:Ig-like domain-containing protein n=1 Tax=Sander lucioperca TaxID=283035 RepID=A0A8C9XJB2_SANLU
LCSAFLLLSDILLKYNKSLVTFSISGVKVVVKEDSDVVLPCSLNTKENIEFKLFDWKKVAQKDAGEKEVFLYDGGSHYNNGRDGQSEEFKGRVSHFQDELKHGNASIIIRNTKISDSGEYTCDFPRLQPHQNSTLSLLLVSTFINSRFIVCQCPAVILGLNTVYVNIGRFFIVRRLFKYNLVILWWFLFLAVILDPCW